MSEHTQRETQTGYPTFGLERGKRSGLGFDTSDNPRIYDASGALRAAWTSTLGTTLTVKLDVVGGASSSGVFASVLNPFGYAVLIMNRVLRVTTASTGAATVDIGVGASATTSNDGLIDGQSVAATGLISANGTNGSSYQVWAPDQYLNVAEASGDVNGLVATLTVSVSRG